MGMRLGQYSSSALSRNWVREIPRVAYCVYLASKGDYVYVQGSSEGSVQKRRRTDGNLIWQKDMMIDVGEIAQVNNTNIAVDCNYNIYTTKDCYLYKYDENGNLIWDIKVEDTVEGCRTIIFSVSADGTRIMLRSVNRKKIYSYKTIDGTKDVEFTPEIPNYTIYSIYYGEYDSNNNFIIDIYIQKVGTPRFILKYNSTGTERLWYNWISSGYINLGGKPIAVDKEDNVWSFRVENNVRKLVKFSRNTGNIMCSASDEGTMLVPLSNGDVATASLQSNVMTLNRFNTNAELQKTETYNGVTALHRMDMAI